MITDSDVKGLRNFCYIGIDLQPAVKVLPDGSFNVTQVPAKAGDYVEMQVELDLVVAATACSVDIDIEGIDAQGGRSTPLRIEIFEQ